MVTPTALKTGLTLSTYSIPFQTQKLLSQGIIQNPLISKFLPPDAAECASKIKYVGSDLPSIPINWRFAESIASLLGLEGTMINCLIKRKYGVEAQEIVIDTDHASLYIMSTIFWIIDPSGLNIRAQDPRMLKYFPSWDKHRSASTPHRSSCTNIYKTSDNRYFHLHGSMNPDPSLASIGIPPDLDQSSVEASWAPFVNKVSKIDSGEMQRLASEVYKQAGTIAYTADEYRESEHGKANAHVGLFEIHSRPNPGQKAGWWKEIPETSVKRPLAGLKVLDITRIIAGPAISRGLAELGASVMRVCAPHLPDLSPLHCDLEWGKWESLLDFREEGDREKMRKLVLEADVVVTGYRPGVLDKYGFGVEDILKTCEGRERGIIFARENCYGWYGPWKDRSGWQQISDACCGVSMEFGRAMGNDEPVTPVFPNSDYCTGVACTSAVLAALIQQAEHGGSYVVDAALNYYSSWLVNSCGVYPDPIWQDVWNRNGRQVFRHYHNMMYLLPHYISMLMKNSGKVLMKPEYFVEIESKAMGTTVRLVAPVLRFPERNLELGYQVGTRTNGLDKPRWPKDLMVELVTDDN